MKKFFCYFMLLMFVAMPSFVNASISNVGVSCSPSSTNANSNVTCTVSANGKYSSSEHDSYTFSYSVKLGNTVLSSGSKTFDIGSNGSGSTTFSFTSDNAGTASVSFSSCSSKTVTTFSGGAGAQASCPSGTSVVFKSLAELSCSVHNGSAEVSNNGSSWTSSNGGAYVDCSGATVTYSRALGSACTSGSTSVPTTDSGPGTYTYYYCAKKSGYNEKTGSVSFTLTEKSNVTPSNKLHCSAPEYKFDVVNNGSTWSPVSSSSTVSATCEESGTTIKYSSSSAAIACSSGSSKFSLSNLSPGTYSYYYCATKDGYESVSGKGTVVLSEKQNVVETPDTTCSYVISAEVAKPSSSTPDHLSNGGTVNVNLSEGTLTAKGNSFSATSGSVSNVSVATINQVGENSFKITLKSAGQTTVTLKGNSGCTVSFILNVIDDTNKVFEKNIDYVKLNSTITINILNSSAVITNKSTDFITVSRNGSSLSITTGNLPIVAKLEAVYTNAAGKEISEIYTINVVDCKELNTDITDAKVYNNTSFFVSGGSGNYSATLNSSKGNSVVNVTGGNKFKFIVNESENTVRLTISDNVSRCSVDKYYNLNATQSSTTTNSSGSTTGNNSGNTNTGSTNTGSSNTGSTNTGSTNAGSTNTGSSNTGNTNTGNTTGSSTNPGSTGGTSINPGSTGTNTNTSGTNSNITNNNNSSNENPGSTGETSTNPGSTGTINNENSSSVDSNSSSSSSNSNSSNNSNGSVNNSSDGVSDANSGEENPQTGISDYTFGLITLIIFGFIISFVLNDNSYFKQI